MSNLILLRFVAPCLCPLYFHQLCMCPHYFCQLNLYSQHFHQLHLCHFHQLGFCPLYVRVIHLCLYFHQHQLCRSQFHQFFLCPRQSRYETPCALDTFAITFRPTVLTIAKPGHKAHVMLASSEMTKKHSTEWDA